MGLIKSLGNFFGPKVHADIMRKTLGDKDGPVSRKNVVAKMGEVAEQWLWSCMVLGDKAFPKLIGKRIFGKIHAGGAIILFISLAVPSLLIGRAFYKLQNFGYRNSEAVKKITRDNIEMNKKILDEKLARQHNKINPVQIDGQKGE